MKENQIRVYSKQDILNRKTKVNFFESIDSEEKAYFLGLLIADGCVFRFRQNTMFVIFALQEQDSYMVELFAKKVSASRKIVIDKRDNSKSITITSNKMADDLSKYGVVENKTFKTYLPKLDSFFMPHLIRGILDGDGNIGCRKRNPKIENSDLRWQVAFCGSEQLMTEIRDYLFSILNINLNKVCKEQSIYSIRWTSRKDVYIICDYLYRDANIYLKRKKEKFEQFCDLYCY